MRNGNADVFYRKDCETIKEKKMIQLTEFFENLKSEDDLQTKGRLLQYLVNSLRYEKKSLSASDRETADRFAAGELQTIAAAIPQAKNYKEKSKIFFYADGLLAFCALMGKESVSDELLAIIQSVLQIISAAQRVEPAVNEAFEQEKIERADIEKIIEIMKSVSDEYERGMLYQTLHENKESMNKLSAGAKEALAEFTAADMERMLKANPLEEDTVNNLEFASDVCKYFVSDAILSALEKLMQVKVNRIRYYALETLLQNGKSIPPQTVAELAEDLEYAELTYRLLEKHGCADLFPAQYATSEYLAKSDLVHWLIYPTELNQPPDEIELLGTVTVKKELFHIFKYKSNSKNLTEDLHNVYLIGWSGSEGGTFSNFDKLSDFEKKTPQKTIKHIAKKLLR